MALDEIDEDDIRAFLVESYENLNQIERDIIDLEKKSTNGEILDRVYRVIHSIKGNCGFLPFPKLEAIAHASENLLGNLRSGKLKLNHSIISGLLQGVDTIRQLLTNIEASSNEGNLDYSTLIKTLTQLQVVGQATGEGARGLGLEARDELGARGLGLEARDSKLESVSKNQISEIPESSGEFPSPQPLAPSPSSSPSSIRVNVGLLDQVMNLVGELVLTRNQLLQYADSLEDTAFNATCQQLNLITSQLQSGVMKTRMQPIGIIWQKFPRVVRDAAIACGKQVQVEMLGASTELDKTIIEAIKDPLTHLIRNCIDHGIETPTVRTQRGKPVVGRLCLRAFHESGKVNIEISDDGSGIDSQQLKQKAQQLGLITASRAASISESEAVNLIFLPGLSTAQQVTNLSGRGVGMDVVKTNIEKINGTVDVYSQLGQGTTFKIKIPLTLAIIPALIVMSGGSRYAISQSSIQELVRLEEQAVNDIEMLYDVPVYRLRGNVLPLVYLNRELLVQDTTDLETINIVVINADNYRFGLVVDEISDTQDIVVKPLGKQLKDLTIYAGATILGDGKVALIIDAIALAKRAGLTLQMQQQLSSTQPQKAQQEDNRQMVLLFHGSQGGRMGIPLTQTFRLEEFPRSAVEKIANQYAIQYRGKILSLIDLHTVFGIADSQDDYSEVCPLPAFKPIKAIPQAEDDIIQVVVVSLNQEHNIGLVVERILDIVEEPLTIKGAASRPGVLFLALIQGQITEILDIENIVRIANPYLLKGN